MAAPAPQIATADIAIVRNYMSKVAEASERMAVLHGGILEALSALNAGIRAQLPKPRAYELATLSVQPFRMEFRGFRHYRIQPQAAGNIIINGLISLPAGDTVALTVGNALELFYPEGSLITAAAAYPVVIIRDDIP